MHELLCVQANYLLTTIVLLHLIFDLLAYHSHTFIILCFGYIGCLSPCPRFRWTTMHRKGTNDFIKANIWSMYSWLTCTLVFSPILYCMDFKSSLALIIYTWLFFIALSQILSSNDNANPLLFIVI